MQLTSLRSSYSRLCSVLFWLMLTCCAFDAAQFIACHSAPIFFADDTTLIDGIHSLENGWFWHWLWSLHNEHREPLPKLLWFPLYLISGDVRSGMYAQVALLGMAAILGRSCAVRLRGAPDLSDLFFPLAFLQIANSENLLMGFQICIAMPVLMVMVVIWALARPIGADAPWRSALCVLCIAGLPLCGGYGLILTLPLTTCIVWRGWITRHVASGKLLLAGGTLPLLALALYFVDYQRPYNAGYEHTWTTLLRHFPVHWGIAFGPYSGQLREWLWYPLALVLLGMLAWSGLNLARSRGKDGLQLALFCVLGASVLYGFSMSHARPAYLDWMVPNRYMPFPLPFLCAALLAALTTPWIAVRFLVPLALTLGMTQSQPAGNTEAYLVGTIRSSGAQEVQELADAASSLNVLAERYQQVALASDALFVRQLLLEFRRRGMPPFGQPDPADPMDGASLSLETPPDETRGPNQLILRRMDSEVVLVIQAPSELVWKLCGSEHSLGLTIEPPLGLRVIGRAVRVPWKVEWQRPDGTVEVLLEGSLSEPIVRKVALPAGATGALSLQFAKPSDEPSEIARAWIVIRNLHLE